MTSPIVQPGIFFTVPKMYSSRIACQIRCQLPSVQRGNVLHASNVRNIQTYSYCRKFLDRERTAIVKNARLISTACIRTASHPLSDGNDFTDSDGPLAKYVQRVEQEVIKVTTVSTWYYSL